MTVMTAYQAQQAYYAPNGQQQLMERLQGLSLMLHGFWKVGKSSTAQTGPRPVLVLDVETAATWTPVYKIRWDPARESCPVWPMDPRAVSAANPQGLWDVCVVIIHDFNSLLSLLQFLARGQHPFNSVSIDSVTTIQQRLMLQLAGLRKMERDHWGQILRSVNSVLFGYRDLLTHPTNPVWSVTFICGTHFDQRVGKWRPLLSGQQADLAPYVTDLTGWLYVAEDETRHLWTGPSKDYETGNRLWGRLPADMQLGFQGVVDGWTVEAMVRQVINR